MIKVISVVSLCGHGRCHKRTQINLGSGNNMDQVVCLDSHKVEVAEDNDKEVYFGDKS